MSNLPTIPWIRELDLVSGWHEVRDFLRLSRWLKSDGKTLGNPTKLPWCGDAMDTAAMLALPQEPRPGDLGKNPYWALNWSWFGKRCTPCYGAIGVAKRPTGGHVGVIVGQTKTAYLVLGGNQGDSVSRVLIAKGRFVDFRWPSTFPNPNVPLPMVNARGLPLSKNEA